MRASQAIRALAHPAVSRASSSREARSHLTVRSIDAARIAELAQRGLLIQKGTILRELRPKELRQADMLQEFVGVGTDAG